MQTGQQVVAAAVLRVASRVRTPAASRSAAQAEIVLAGPARSRTELRMTPAEAARLQELRRVEFDLDRVLAKGRVWRPRAREWALDYSQDW